VQSCSSRVALKATTHVGRIAKTARSQFSNGKCGDPTDTGSNQSTSATGIAGHQLQEAGSWSLQAEQLWVSTIVMFR